MSNLNQITLIGRIGKPVEIKEVNGSKVANFTIAVSDKYKNKAGEQVEETEWFDCVVWNKPAEIIEKYVSKGDLLFVQGKIKTRSWEKDGVKHYAKDVIVSDFKFFPKAKVESGLTTASGTMPNQQTPLDEGDGLPF